MRRWLVPAWMIGLVFVAFWSANEWSGMGLIRFRTGEELFCYSLTTDSVGVTCQGPAFRNSTPALPMDSASRYTWPWALVDHIQRQRSYALLSASDPVWVRLLFYTVAALLSLAGVVLPLFMLRGLVRFLRS